MSGFLQGSDWGSYLRSYFIINAPRESAWPRDLFYLSTLVQARVTLNPRQHRACVEDLASRCSWMWPQPPSVKKLTGSRGGMVVQG